VGITAKQLIDSAARKIGVSGKGLDMDASDYMDFLEGLKMMLDGWALEHLMIPYRTKETFTLDGSSSYTIGPGGDFDTVRPLAIADMRISNGSGTDFKVTSVELEQWNRLSATISVGRPNYFFLEAGYPLSTIWFEKAPDDPNVTFWSYKPIEAWQVGDLDVADNPAWAGQDLPTSGLSIATLLADIEFDVGYEAAIVFNLAIVMAPEYEKIPSIVVLNLADSYKSRIKNQNIRVGQLTVDSGLGVSRPYYDITAGPG